MKAVLVLADVRSAHNVGVLWRTAEAAGAEAIWLCGITPHPAVEDDGRPPYVASRNHEQIKKTALGAERLLPFEYRTSTEAAIRELRQAGYRVVALELADDATPLFEWQPAGPTALVVGHEKTGLMPEVLRLADETVAIPMSGRKESLNVAVAGSLGLYWLAHQLGR